MGGRYKRSVTVLPFNTPRIRTGAASTRAMYLQVLIKGGPEGSVSTI